MSYRGSSRGSRAKERLVNAIPHTQAEKERYGLAAAVLSILSVLYVAGTLLTDVSAVLAMFLVGVLAISSIAYVQQMAEGYYLGSMMASTSGIAIGGLATQPVPSNWMLVPGVLGIWGLMFTTAVGAKWRYGTRYPVSMTLMAMTAILTVAGSTIV